MNISIELIHKLEDLDVRVYGYDSDSFEDNTLELEMWTNGGVNMFIILDNISGDEDVIRGIAEYRDNFEIDEEIMLHMEGSSYVKSFTIKESLEDFESHLEFIDLILVELRKPNTYTVPVVYESWGTVEVQADSREDLLEKLNDKDFVDKMALPLESEYIDDSYEIDFEGLEK